MSEPVSVYIHVPFCVKKCRYCDFYSLEDLSLVKAWGQALVKEIRLRKKTRFPFRAQGTRPLASTLYFGGGTPSVLSLDILSAILAAVHDAYQLPDNAEVSFEVNPGTVGPGYLAGLRQLGINRLSIGVQSFDPEKLAFLGRIHSKDQAVKVIEQARASGFDRIGLDLMYALPHESAADWARDMEVALTHEPAHVSCYMLTLEPGTPLYRACEQHQFLPVDTDTKTRLFLKTSAGMEQAGYRHYEISNFAKGRDNQSRHNSNYWNMTPYDGFGPSAHSFVHHRDSTLERSWNKAHVRSYIRDLESGKLPVEEKEWLTPCQKMLERIMVGLRTRNGVDVGRFNEESGMDFDTKFQGLVSSILNQGLGERGETSGSADHGPREFFRLTRAGWARLDSVVESFADLIL